MGPEFGMIKDENEDPSSPKKEKKKSRIEKKGWKKIVQGREGGIILRRMLCHTGGECERAIKSQKYKKQEDRGRQKQKKKKAAAIVSVVAYFCSFNIFMNGRSPLHPHSPLHNVILYSV